MSVVSDIFAGGAAGIFEGISSIIKNFKADPLEVAKLAAAVEQARIAYASVAAQAEMAVNATMQAEAKSEHWLTWSWRPLVGYSFVATISNNYLVMPYFQHILQPIVIPSEVFYAWLAILGVSAGFRGLSQWQERRNGK